ncbi:MAG: hypothetical protein JWO73_138 [Candidatus Taylorbacteria bacterium]|nr:hypothetical protein [Candidatus Taylorbacteria bacterium]
MDYFISLSIHELWERAIFLRILVFMPRDGNEEEVEDRQEYEKDRMRMRIPVYLIQDESAEDADRDRICPELVADEPDDEEELDDTVADQICGDEELAVRSEVWDEMLHVRRDEIIRIFDELLLRQENYQARDRSGE